jgi:hypothetical protein
MVLFLVETYSCIVCVLKPITTCIIFFYWAVLYFYRVEVFLASQFDFCILAAVISMIWPL